MLILLESRSAAFVEMRGVGSNSRVFNREGARRACRSATPEERGRLSASKERTTLLIDPSRRNSHPANPYSDVTPRLPTAARTEGGESTFYFIGCFYNEFS